MSTIQERIKRQTEERRPPFKTDPGDADASLSLLAEAPGAPTSVAGSKPGGSARGPRAAVAPAAGGGVMSQRKKRPNRSRERKVTIHLSESEYRDLRSLRAVDCGIAGVLRGSIAFFMAHPEHAKVMQELGRDADGAEA